MNNVIQTPLLSSFSSIAHGFQTMKEPFPSFAHPQNLMRIRQIHRTEIHFIDHSKKDIVEGDGCMTQNSSPCAIQTADCLPILSVRKDGQRVAAFHAGWRGTFLNFPASWANFLKTEHENQIKNDEPTQWIYSLGPCIQTCCFEIQEDLILELKKLLWVQDPHNFLVFTEGKVFLNLQKLFYHSLILQNVPAQQIEQNSLCTCCAKGEDGAFLFFSYRRNRQEAGRQISWIRKILT